MPRHITAYTVAEEPDAMESTSSVLLNAQTVKQTILRLRFVKSIATNLFAGQFAEVASQTAMHQDQDASIPVSLVGMVESSTSTERATNTSP